MSHIETLGQLADARAEIARLTAELAKRDDARALREQATIEAWSGAHAGLDEAARLECEAKVLDRLPDDTMDTLRVSQAAAIRYLLRARKAEAELAAARAVPANVEVELDSLRPYLTGGASLDYLKAAIARAIAEARRPATVGGLLATAPVGSIVEYQRANTQWQARMVDEFATVRFWIERQFRWSKWKIMPVPLSLFARLVPAAEADRDPATRGEICAPAMATTVHCGVCAKPAANKNHEPGGDEQPTCDRCMDATRGPLPKGG